MAIQSKKEPIILFLGDVIFLYISLFLMIFVSYSGFPVEEVAKHTNAFSVLFVVWIFIFFIAGLYEKHTLLFKSKLPSVILNTQGVNIAIAVLFFYLIPYFGITPKTNLFIYLIISFSLILLWRIYGYPRLGSGRKEKALVVGSGEEMKELITEVNNNSRYSLRFSNFINLDSFDIQDLETEIYNFIKNNGIQTVVIDLKNEKIQPILSTFYNLIYLNVKFIDKHALYEDIFDRVPLSLINDSWLLENISFSPKPSFDFIKRVGDIAGAIVLGLVSLFLTPFVALAIKLESSGPILIKQTRVGKGNMLIDLFKFRTMTRDDKGESVLTGTNEITKVGAFLRKTRIDELPQLLSVLKGDISLIGPRPEFPDLVDIYHTQVSYYNVRHLIKPGLSGWAQLYQSAPPKFGAEEESTKIKLSYDLYYIKNRSVILDIKIGLKTIKDLLSRRGV